MSYRVQLTRIVSFKMPRLHGFDTGFVSHARGWNPLRPDDCGFLWDHLVLEHLQSFHPDLPLHDWRDKTGREVDFVVVRNRDEVDAIECKWVCFTKSRTRATRIRMDIVLESASVMP